MTFGWLKIKRFFKMKLTYTIVLSAILISVASVNAGFVIHLGMIVVKKKECADMIYRGLEYGARFSILAEKCSFLYQKHGIWDIGCIDTTMMDSSISKDLIFHNVGYYSNSFLVKGYYTIFIKLDDSCDTLGISNRLSTIFERYLDNQTKENTNDNTDYCNCFDNFYSTVDSSKYKIQIGCLFNNTPVRSNSNFNSYISLLLALQTKSVRYGIRDITVLKTQEYKWALPTSSYYINESLGRVVAPAISPFISYCKSFGRITLLIETSNLFLFKFEKKYGQNYNKFKWAGISLIPYLQSGILINSYFGFFIEPSVRLNYAMYGYALNCFYDSNPNPEKSIWFQFALTMGLQFKWK